MLRFFKFYLIVFVVTGCTSSRFVKPLDKGQKAFFGNFGGPLIEFSEIPMPIPFATIGYGQGIHHDITLYSAIDLTSAIFGVWHHEIGMSANILKLKNNYAFSVQPGMHMFQNLQTFNAFRMYPVMDISFYKQLPQQQYEFYCNGRFWINAYANQNPEWQGYSPITTGIYFGLQKHNKQWGHQFELGCIAPNTPNTPNVVNFIGLQGKGALVLHYSILRYF